MLYHEEIFGLCDADSQFYGDIIGFGEEMSELALWPYVEVIAQTQPGQVTLLCLRIRSSKNDCHALTLAISGIYRALFSWWLCFARQEIQPFSPKKREPFLGVAEIQNHFLRRFELVRFRVTREA
jgi:hypothetical protein